MRRDTPQARASTSQFNPAARDALGRDPVDFLRMVLSSIVSQLAVVSASGEILLTNAAWNDFAGPEGTLAERPKTGENYFRSLAAVTGPECGCAQQLLQAAANLLKDPQPEESAFDLEVRTEQFSQEFVLLARLARFESPEGPRLTCTYRDVTPIHLAQQQLRESEERFKFAVEGTGGAVWDWDVASCTVRHGYQLAKMLGLPRVDSFQANLDAFHQRLHPDDLERTSRRFDDLIQGTADSCAMEHRLRHEDGTWRWIMTRCAVMNRDATGHAARILGVHHDITDLKEVEASLRDQRNQNRMLAKVAEHTTNSVIITDAMGRILWTNRGFSEVTGYSLEEALGRKPGALLQGPGTDPSVVATIRSQLAKALPVRQRLLNYRKDGRPFWLNLEIQPAFTVDGALESFVAIMEDLTERESLEAELRLSQKLECVGQLAAGIAHEINTPIQYVSDSVTFLEEAWRDLEVALHATGTPHAAMAAHSSVDPAKIDFLVENFPGAIARARDGVQRVASIVRAMKEFSHPDQAQYAGADINRAVQNALVVTHNEVKYVGTASAVLGDIPHVACRIGLINQVLLNLLVNAAHALADKGHTPETGRVEVRTQLEGNHVVIRVSDNGCGIRDEIRERIFDPFFTTKEVGRGTGQGLALTRAIVVEQHGGRITVESRVGEGSCFSVWLPVTQQGDGP